MLYVNTMLSTDNGTFLTHSLVDQAESMADGTANASTQDLIPLQAGHTYKFGVGVSSNSPVSVSTGYCTAFVLVCKAA